MKLRNKKTGEIIEICKINPEPFEAVDFNCSNLAELEREWEDYEEPKEYWYIDYEGGILLGETDNSSAEKMMMSIGNYFNTLSEAEKAVENLKAIKILKDNGFRFIQWEFDMKTIADGKIWFDVGVNTQWDAEQLLKHRPEVKKSLDLLFGGEE